METRRGFWAKREAAAARSRSSVAVKVVSECPDRYAGLNSCGRRPTFLDVRDAGCLGTAGDGRILGRGVLGSSGIHSVSGRRCRARNHGIDGRSWLLVVKVGENRGEEGDSKGPVQRRAGNEANNQAICVAVVVVVVGGRRLTVRERSSCRL
jgi:hypothetical protein